MLGIGADVADAGAPVTSIYTYVDGHDTAFIELVMKAPPPAAEIEHNLRSINVEGNYALVYGRAKT